MWSSIPFPGMLFGHLLVNLLHCWCQSRYCDWKLFDTGILIWTVFQVGGGGIVRDPVVHQEVCVIA